MTDEGSEAIVSEGNVEVHVGRLRCFLRISEAGGRYPLLSAPGGEAEMWRIRLSARMFETARYI